MTRRAFLRKYFPKFTAALALVGLIVYTLYHALGSSAGSLLTTPARRVTDTDTLSGEAVLFRAESVIALPAAGLVNDLVASGSKVAKDVPVAELWVNRTSLDLGEAQRLLDRCNRMLSMLEASRVQVGEPLSNAEKYKKNANEAFLAIKRATASGDLSSAAALQDEMFGDLARYATLTGQDKMLDDVIRSIESNKASILVGEDQIPLINDQSSGYFYDRSYVDGGETIFTEEALAALTPTELDGLLERLDRAGTPAATAGKMVRTHEWRIAVKMTAEEAGSLIAGRVYRVSFPENGGTTLNLTCERTVSDEQGRAIAILHSGDHPTEFDYLRTQRVEIELASRTGYYLPEQALRTSETGVEGVYIFENSTVYFRRVEIIHRKSGYVIVREQGDLGHDYLALNDVVVISGANLYEGRVLR
jgi:hypothetical protein